MSYYRIIPQNQMPRRDWISTALEIKAARDEARQYAAIMTPYERMAVQRSIQERIEADFQHVYTGAMGHLSGAIDKFMAAKEATQRERMREINRWDMGKLAAEMQAYQTLVTHAMGAGRLGEGPFKAGSGAASRIARLYEEARASGDVHKQRAAAEVLQGLSGLLSEFSQDERPEALGLSRRAEEDLAGLREAEGLKVAQEAERAAAEGLLQARQDVYSVGVTMGEDVDGVFSDGPYTRAVRRVQIDRATGELAVFNPDADEVTGRGWENMIRREESKGLAKSEVENEKE